MRMAAIQTSQLRVGVGCGFGFQTFWSYGLVVCLSVESFHWFSVFYDDLSRTSPSGWELYTGKIEGDYYPLISVMLTPVNDLTTYIN